MPKEHHQSREEWEQELWEKQLNLTPGRSRRPIFLTKSGGPGETFNTLGLIRLVVGIILLALGITAFSWKVPHSLAIALTAVVVSLYLILKTLLGRSS